MLVYYSQEDWVDFNTINYLIIKMETIKTPDKTQYIIYEFGFNQETLEPYLFAKIDQYSLPGYNNIEVQSDLIPVSVCKLVDAVVRAVNSGGAFIEDDDYVKSLMVLAKESMLEKLAAAQKGE